MHLLDLPQELLDTILRHCLVDVDDYDRLKSGASYKENVAVLTRACQVCKQFDATARPLLYHTFVKPENLYSSKRRWFEVGHMQDNHVLRRFIRTLLKERHLARHVRRLVLRPWKNHWAVHNRVDSGLSVKDEREYKQLLAEHIDDFELSPVRSDAERASPCSRVQSAHEIWRRALLDDYWEPPLDRERNGRSTANYVEDAEIALLLMLTPHVEVLDTYIPGTTGMIETADESRYLWEPFFHLAIRSLLVGIPGRDHFRQLRAIHSLDRGAFGGPPFPLRLLLEMMAFPLVQTFSGRLAIAEASSSHCTKWDNEAIDRQPGIRTMHLRPELAPPKILKQLLTFPRALKRLSIAYSNRLLSRHAIGTGGWSGVRSALSPCASTLESLSLSIQSPDGNTPVEIWAEMWPASIDTLHDFTRLRSLAIHQSAFLQLEQDGPPHRRPLADVLPRSLTSLKILCFDNGLLPQMDAYVAVVPELYSALRKVEVHLGNFCNFDADRAYPPHNLVRGAEEHMDRVITDFGRLGIEFVEMA